MEQHETERMLIRTEQKEDAERIAAAFSAENIAVNIEEEADCTLFYVAKADETRAQAVLTSIGQLSSEETSHQEPQPSADGRSRSIALTVVMLLLVVLAVYGTDLLIELVQKLFS